MKSLQFDLEAFQDQSSEFSNVMEALCWETINNAQMVERNNFGTIAEETITELRWILIL